MPDADGKTSIRGIDPELFASARASALQMKPKKQNIGEWMNLAISARLKKLEREKKPKT